MQELAFLAKYFETTVEANTNTVAHVLLDQKTGDINSMVDGIAEAGEFKTDPIKSFVATIGKTEVVPRHVMHPWF